MGANCNFDPASAMLWHDVFKKNKTVQVLDLSSNPWRADLMVQWVSGLSNCTNLEELRLNNMNFGNGGHSTAVEKSLCEALEQSSGNCIVKLGMELKDPNWRNKIDRRIMQNKDLARQKRNAAKQAAK